MKVFLTDLPKPCSSSRVNMARLSVLVSTSSARPNARLSASQDSTHNPPPAPSPASAKRIDIFVSWRGSQSVPHGPRTTPARARLAGPAGR
jgi:hypothetical protein